MAQLLLDESSTGAYQISTDNLDELVQTLGDEVFRAFCSCWIQADRVVSLTSLNALSEEAFPGRTCTGLRNFIAFYVFLVGTLKELGLSLESLRSALVNRGLWNRDAWAKSLRRWEDWGKAKDNSLVRNKVSFHVDPEVMANGLADRKSVGSAVISQGDDRKTQRSYWAIAHEVLFAGLATNVSDLQKTLEEPAELLPIDEALAAEFARVAMQAGVQLRSKNTAVRPG